MVAGAAPTIEDWSVSEGTQVREAVTQTPHTEGTAHNYTATAYHDNTQVHACTCCTTCACMHVCIILIIALCVLSVHVIELLIFISSSLHALLAL